MLIKKKVVYLHHKTIEIMKKFKTNLEGRKLELRKVYTENDKFFGWVLVRGEGFRTGFRITKKEWDSF